MLVQYFWEIVFYKSVAILTNNAIYKLIKSKVSELSRKKKSYLFILGKFESKYLVVAGMWVLVQNFGDIVFNDRIF